MTAEKKAKAPIVETPRCRPFEDLLAVAAGETRPDVAADASTTNFQRSATQRLVALLSEPWTYTVSRLLLQEDPLSIHKICSSFGLQEPYIDALRRGHWIVSGVRGVYESALVRTLSELIQARADVNAAAPESSCRTPLMCCAVEGLMHVAALLLRAGAEVGRADTSGRTALHWAAVQQEMNIISMLLKAGADPEESDTAGITTRNIADVLALELSIEDGGKGGAASVSSGAAPKRPRRSTCCSIRAPSALHVVEAGDPPMSASSFFRCFASLRRPLVLKCRGEGCWPHLSAKSRWSRDKLIACVGESQVEVGTIPYSDDFGSKEDMLPITLQRYLEVEVDLFGSHGDPLYLFTIVDHVLQPHLARLIRDELGDLNACLPAPFTEFSASNVQFAVGNTGSGSPAHFHDDAFNVLLSGRKRWWLWPPSKAAMSRVHPSDRKSVV